MAKKIVRKEISESDVISSQFSGKQYQIEMLKDVFVKSGMSARRICKKYDIDLQVLLNYASKFDWFRKKEDHDRMILHEALNMRRDNFLQTLDSDERELMLRNFQREQELSYVEEYRKEHGHLFLIDENKNIAISRVTGMPIRMEFGSTKDALIERKGLQESVETSVKLLRQAIQEAPILLNSSEEDAQLKKIEDQADKLLDE